MRISLPILLLCLAGCGDAVDVVVVVPGFAHGAFGKKMPGRTARFYEGDKLFALKSGQTIDVTAVALPLPLASKTHYVVGPWAVLHDDVNGEDRGRLPLRFGSNVDVGSSLGGPRTVLLLKGGLPWGFARAADVRDGPPDARELVAAAKAALLSKDLENARTFALAALQADEKHPPARRLAGAFQNHEGDARGWALWTSARPPDPPVDLPDAPAAVVGAAFVNGSGVSLRAAAATTAKRLGFLDTGASVTVRAIDGEWAAVDRARTVPRRETIDWASLVDGSTLPSTTTSTDSAASGFVAVKLLSSVKPDPSALRDLGLQRVAAGQFDAAIVPLTRSLAMNPVDDRTREALFRAAVETERHVLALQTLERPPVASGVRFEIKRVRGCLGDVDKARGRIEDAAGILVAPTWDSDKDEGVAGVVNLPKSENVCFEDGEEERACGHDRSVVPEQNYLGAGCGDEIVPTPEQQRAYRAYVVTEGEVVAHAEREWQRYADSFAAWTARRDAALSAPAVAVHIENDVDQPARTLALYGFKWTISGWCGSVGNAERTELTVKTVQLPAGRAGEVTEVWVTGVDLDKAWGAALLNDADDRAAFEKALATPQIDNDQFRGAPEAWAGRADEAGRGIATCSISFDCCGC